jgi:hypothetical protein
MRLIYAARIIDDFPLHIFYDYLDFDAVLVPNPNYERDSKK